MTLAPLITVTTLKWGCPTSHTVELPDVAHGLATLRVGRPLVSGNPLMRFGFFARAGRLVLRC